MRKKVLSLISPIFNEEENIAALYEQLSSIGKQLKHFTDYEIIVINDGSRDSSLQKLTHFAQQDSHLKIVSFTRNFGHEAATTAGLFHASGDAAVIIDADLQDPPELIFDFEREWRNGYDIVYGQRSKRLDETIVKKVTSKLFYPIFRWLTKLDMPRDIGDFCLLSRHVIDTFKQLPERSLFVRGMIYWPGFSKKAVLFVRKKRAAGKTKYNYWKLTKFAIDNILSFSTFPLYALLFLSALSIFFCLCGVTIALIMHFKGFVVMTGWTSLLISQLFLFSVTLFFLSFVGLYIGKIFEEVKRRPRYVIDKMINYENYEK